MPTRIQPTASDPLEIYDALAMEGRAPDPRKFAADYPDHPDLLDRIEALEALRSQLDGALKPAETGPHLPERIGDFVVGGKLGEGAMGWVYAAQHHQTGERCAIKVLRWSSEVAKRRFDREARLAAGLEHPGLARVLDYGVAGEVAFIATERIDGRSLSDIIKDEPGLPEGEEVRRRVELMRDVATALGYAHEQGVIHRDVKPSNIMIDQDGKARLIDFGIAVAPGGGDERITRTGIFVGSWGYAAPEQLRGSKVEMGTWTDTYALLASLYQLLTGRTPFPGATLAARLSAGQSKPDYGPRHHNSNVSRSLNRLIMKGLHPVARKRFRDGNALTKALTKWLR